VKTIHKIAKEIPIAMNVTELEDCGEAVGAPVKAVFGPSVGATVGA
jgi:hypothetical protein